MNQISLPQLDQGQQEGYGFMDAVKKVKDIFQVAREVQLPDETQLTPDEIVKDFIREFVGGQSLIAGNEGKAVLVQQETVYSRSELDRLHKALTDMNQGNSQKFRKEVLGRLVTRFNYKAKEAADNEDAEMLRVLASRYQLLSDLLAGK